MFVILVEVALKSFKAKVQSGSSLWAGAVAKSGPGHSFGR